MWFKNLYLYRLHAQAAIALEVLEQAMSSQAARPLGGSEATRLGWRTPGGRNSTRYVHEIQGQRLLSALRQDRQLPADVVREEVEERAADREAAEGRRLPRRERQAIKEQVYEEFLPRAFVRSQRIDLWWDTQRQLIGINTASRKRAEEVLDLLRQTLGSLKVTPLATQTLPIRTMTQWLEWPERRPAGLVLGNAAVIKDSGGDGVVRASRMDLDSDQIQYYRAVGMQASRLAIEIEDRIALTLHDDLSLHGLVFGDALLSEAAQADDGDDAILRLETDFALMAQALGAGIDQLIGWLGGDATQGDTSQAAQPAA